MKAHRVIFLWTPSITFSKVIAWIFTCQLLQLSRALLREYTNDNLICASFPYVKESSPLYIGIYSACHICLRDSTSINDGTEMETSNNAVHILRAGIWFSRDCCLSCSYWWHFAFSVFGGLCGWNCLINGFCHFIKNFKKFTNSTNSKRVMNFNDCCWILNWIRILCWVGLFEIILRFAEL